MKSIYTKARKLTAWLPSPADRWHSHDASFDANIHLAHVVATSSNLQLSNGKIDQYTGLAFTRLVTHEYWSRLWIVQELRLSRRKEFWWEG